MINIEDLKMAMVYIKDCVAKVGEKMPFSKETKELAEKFLDEMHKKILKEEKAEESYVKYRAEKCEITRNTNNHLHKDWRKSGVDRHKAYSDGFLAGLAEGRKEKEEFLGMFINVDLEKENAELKKNLDRYSQKIAEQEETIDAQDDKINFYVAKMNENILKRKELEKENGKLKDKLNLQNQRLNELKKENEKQKEQLEELTRQKKKDEYMNTIQLAEWLARGNGFVRDGDEVATTIQFVEYHSDFTTRNLKIKSFGADDWEEPLLAIYERDCINRGNNNL